MMTFTWLLAFAGLTGTFLFIVLPELGIDLSSGLSFQDQPILALMATLAGLVTVAVFGYTSAIAASWVALRFYPRSAVEAEFRWLLSWFKWDPPLNGALFRWIFRE